MQHARKTIRKRGLDFEVLNKEERDWILYTIGWVADGARRFDCPHPQPCFRRECISRHENTDHDLKMIRQIYKKMKT